MAQNFIAADRDQVFLLPPDVREWLEPGHLAWFVIDAVAGLDLSRIYSAYRADGHGRPAHEPAMMVALVLYGYAVGVRSSRQIERRCREDVAFRVLAANLAPDHATIARFLARHREALAGLFTQVLAMCGRAGLASVGVVAIDGTKLAGNASLDANRGYPAIRAEVERMLAEGAAIDAAEDALYGDARGDELPAELADPARRRARLEQIRREMEAEDAAQREAFEQAERERAAHRARHRGKNPPGRPPKAPDPDALAKMRRNTTDPDSAVMRHRGMAVQGYNAQVVANEQQVILAAELSTEAVDQALLAPMLAAVQERLKRAGIQASIKTALADSAYFNHAGIDAAHAAGIRLLVPPESPHARTPRQRPLRDGPRARAMRAALETPEGKDLYRRRQAIVEPVFARTKHHRGITRLLRRGLAACQAEWQLIATGHNLLKLYSAIQPA
jgi:transposase